MKKLLLIMLASLFMLTSCDVLSLIEEEETEYATLTKERYDEISPILFGIDTDEQEEIISAAYDDAMEEAGNAFMTSGTTEYATYSGDGYSGTISISGMYKYTVDQSATYTLINKLSADETYNYSGTMTEKYTVDQDLEVTGTGDDSIYNGTKLIEVYDVFNLTFENTTIETITGNFKISMLYTFVNLTYSDSIVPAYTFSGTLTIDGINYKGSEFGEFLLDSFED